MMAGDPTLISVADYERAAERLLGPPTRSYYFGGAGDEVTLRDNVRAWQRVAIHPTVLAGRSEPDPGVTVLGRPRPHPLIVAPTAGHELADPEGEIATARAAAATSSVMCLSTLAHAGVSEVARRVPDLSRWFQLYVFRDRAVSDDLVAQAVEHGYEALVVTVDAPVVGLRERELRFPLQGGPADAASMIDPSLSWEDIERLASACPLPLAVKGILTVGDARLAMQHGARAVVVSNHGGRQLDTVIATADALGPIVDEVGADIDVLVDGGIRRGTDVVKALALGAKAVLLGRPVLYGLAVAGSEGARHVLELLLAEFTAGLALSGARTAAELSRAMVGPAPWGVGFN
jgi:4-hydroxymandelate oxidase